jgi:acetate kinase
MGGVDAIVLGGGVAKAAAMHSMILDGLQELGIEIDENAQRRAPAIISKGKVKILILEADEEAQMYKAVEGYFSQNE